MEGFQKVANRITLGLILAALIVGAAMLMRVETTSGSSAIPASRSSSSSSPPAGAWRSCSPSCSTTNERVLVHMISSRISVAPSITKGMASMNNEQARALINQQARAWNQADPAGDCRRLRARWHADLAAQHWQGHDALRRAVKAVFAAVTEPRSSSPHAARGRPGAASQPGARPAAPTAPVAPSGTRSSSSSRRQGRVLARIPRHGRPQKVLIPVQQWLYRPLDSLPDRRYNIPLERSLLWPFLTCRVWPEALHQGREVPLRPRPPKEIASPVTFVASDQATSDGRDRVRERRRPRIESRR